MTLISDNDFKMLIIIRKHIIEISKSVYRDYKFFFQAENKEQRRRIYNYKIENDSETYPIVCRSFCEKLKEDFSSLYNFDIDVICCDNDEFGHCDILVHGDKDYIINCLSDLELNQVGMMPKRFASREYCEERYPELLDNEKMGFLSSDEVKSIDKEIGFFDEMYFDDVIERLAAEFHRFSWYLKSDEGLRQTLVGDVDVSYVDGMDTLKLLQTKFKFLCNYFNGRENIIGHIELIRICKILLKKFFTKEELELIKWSNCFFDKDSSSMDNPIFDTSQSRVRFISFEVGDMVFLISIVSNEFLYMNVLEWEQFKAFNGVISSSISGSNESISEYLRNKGVGVNIIKHSVVKQLLNDIENCLFYGKTDSQKKEILNSVTEQNQEVVLFDDCGNKYRILLDDNYIEIDINGDTYTYSYLGDDLVLSSADEEVTYVWKDEGKYGTNVFRKCSFRK